MKFRSTCASSALSFECGDKRYDVPVGGTFDVPDIFAYAIAKMGVLAEPVVSDEELEKATRPEPVVSSSSPEPESPPSKKSR